ncbi:MAG TPA: DUF1801 domain-containing protein [Naasia sp.]|jgi:hypothetical protein
MSRAEVDAHLAGLDSPLAPALVELCAVVRGADPRIREEIKWNSPSFAIAEHFATTNLRPGAPLLLVLHAGARKKRGLGLKAAVADPDGLLEWKSPDRALLTFTGAGQVRERTAAVRAILSDWIAATQ